MTVAKLNTEARTLTGRNAVIPAGCVSVDTREGVSPGRGTRGSLNGPPELLLSCCAGRGPAQVTGRPQRPSADPAGSAAQRTNGQKPCWDKHGRIEQSPLTTCPCPAPPTPLAVFRCNQCRPGLSLTGGKCVTIGAGNKCLPRVAYREYCSRVRCRLRGTGTPACTHASKSHGQRFDSS